VITPALGAALMSLSTIIVSINARLLRLNKRIQTEKIPSLNETGF
jgi:cation transport ATPase